MPFELVTPQKGHRTHTNVSVGTSAVPLVVKNGNRKSVTFQNQGSVTVFIGDVNVANTGGATGYALFAGTTFTDNASNEAWYAIGASSTSNVHCIDID